MAKSALIFGARNLGKAIIETLIADGWGVAGVARSDATLAGVKEAGAFAIRADVTDTVSVGEALTMAAEANGSLDLVVNAAAAYGGNRSGPFGGGPLADAAPDAFDAWAVAPARAAFTFLSATSRFLVDAGRGGTIFRSPAGRRGARCPAAGCGPPARSACARSRWRPHRSCASAGSTSHC